MKNLITLILIVICSSFTSCKKTAIEQILTQKDDVWYIFDYDSISKNYRNSNYGYIFKSNGDCDYVYYDFSENKLASYLGEMSRDIVVDNSWEYNKDKAQIIILSSKYDSISYNNDTVYLSYNNNRHKILVNLKYKNPRTLPLMKIARLNRIQKQ